jgi:hypothetical protein
VVNLAKGENFAPWFLKKVRIHLQCKHSKQVISRHQNANGTLPTLEADGKVYPDTTSATAYIIKHSLSSVTPGSPLIALIHEDKYDPNFAKISLVSTKASFGAKYTLSNIIAKREGA